MAIEIIKDELKKYKVYCINCGTTFTFDESDIIFNGNEDDSIK